jgi:tRNA_anti-like
MGSAVNAVVMPSSTRLVRKSSHKRCARCGKVVSSRALNCRRCGKKQRANPRTLLLLLAVAFIGSIFAVTGVMSVSYGRRRDVVGPLSATPGTPLTTASTAPAGDRISAVELWEQYSVNAAHADVRYKNKKVAVTGTVADVRRDYKGNLLLRLTTGDALETVRATVAYHDDSGWSIPTRGQIVSLRCTGGGVQIGSPLLESCLPL